MGLLLYLFDVKVSGLGGDRPLDLGLHEVEAEDVVPLDNTRPGLEVGHGDLGL